MSFASFLANPKAYLKIHAMQLNGGAANLIPAAVTRGAPAANAAHGQSVQYTHVGNATMTQSAGVGPKNNMASAQRSIGIMSKRSVTYVPAVGGAYPNLRILPWEGTNVTFMQLAGGADFAITGPLTGCTIGAVRHGGAVWFFHANVAGGGGVTPANLATKRTMIQNAGTNAGIPAAAAYSYCEFGTHYNGLGFAWGRLRNNGNWKFYVHDVNPGGPVADAKWAEI